MNPGGAQSKSGHRLALSLLKPALIKFLEEPKHTLMHYFFRADCQAEGGERGRLDPSCYVYLLSNVTLISQKHCLTDPHRALPKEPSSANRPARGQLEPCLPDLLGKNSLARHQLFCLHRPQCWDGLSTVYRIILGV